METTKTLLAGLGGAIALTLLHEGLKRMNAAPRLDVLGEEAVGKALQPLDAVPMDHKNLYTTTLVADVISNALYYSMIGAGGTKNTYAKAVGLGLTAGLGALALPQKMGLDDTPVTKSTLTKALTVGYYLFGALVTATLLKKVART